MSTLYVAALCGFALVLLLFLVDAMVSVARTPDDGSERLMLKSVRQTNDSSALR